MHIMSHRFQEGHGTAKKHATRIQDLEKHLHAVRSMAATVAGMKDVSSKAVQMLREASDAIDALLKEVSNKMTRIIL